MAQILMKVKGPKKHISKNKDRDIPYKHPYNEAPEGKDIPIKSLCLCAFSHLSGRSETDNRRGGQGATAEAALLASGL